MTRDGAVSVNLVTGETTYPSDRTPEQDHSASGDTVGAAGKAVDRAELHREQAAAKKKRRKQRRTYREGEAAAGRPSSRLQFSEADRAVPELQGAIRKSDKAADRLDAARDAIPNKSPGKPHANPLSRPIQEAGAALHGKVREVEQENSGVQSGHLGERSFEKAVALRKPPCPELAGGTQAETLARRGKGGAGGGQGQCGFLLSESRGGEPPACIQSHLPPVAETEAAKAICGGIPGGGQDRPSRENSRGHGKGGQENRPGVQAHRPFPETALEGSADRGRHRPSAGDAAGLPCNPVPPCSAAGCLISWHLPISPRMPTCWRRKKPTAPKRMNCESTWIPTRPPTTMTSITSTWTKSSMTPMC